LNDVEGRPAIFYIHPWEIDPDQPRLPGSWLSRFRHYRNLGETEGRLERLVSNFAFASLVEVLAKESQEQRASPPVHASRDSRLVPAT
jgi:hypothetical protein